MTQVYTAGQSRGAGTALTGTVSETILATVTLPAGRLNKDGRLTVEGFLTATNNANAKTLNVRLGGIAGTVLYTTSVASVAQADFRLLIANRGATNSQIAWKSGAAKTTAAVDMSVTQDLVITMTLGNAGDSVTLEDYVVQVVEATP
jgi:type IV pilus biogenesis protein CpaD/CtpE